MQYPFAVLAPDYTTALERMQITRITAVEATAERLVTFIDAGKYDAGCQATGVPVAWAAASFEREASSNFALNPAQGWPLDSKSKDVPYNGPFADWTTAQIAAYEIDGLDKVGAANWTWARACYEDEAFNGFGYRAHGIFSPYLGAGTNLYTEGKYVADGQWSPTAIDVQLGTIPIMLQIIRLRPKLALADAFPNAVGVGTIIPAPVPAPVPQGLHDAAALQRALNSLGADPQLVVDDNYGRGTRRAVVAFQQHAGLTPVDGIAGTDTWAAIDQRLAA